MKTREEQQENQEHFHRTTAMSKIKGRRHEITQNHHI